MQLMMNQGPNVYSNASQANKTQDPMTQARQSLINRANPNTSP